MKKLTGWQIVVVVCFACAVIGGLECYAISQGIDGTLLAGALTLIGAIVGGTLGFRINKK